MKYTPESNKLHALFGRGRQHTWHKNQTIQSSADRKMVSMVMVGYVKRYLILNDGSLGVQAIYGPGTIFPLSLVFKTIFERNLYNGPETYYYGAMGDVTTRTVTEADFKAAINDRPDIYKDILYETGERLSSNIQRIENRAIGSAYRCLAHQLYHYTQKFGVPCSTGVEIPLPLTQQDLADILALTRETITKNMSKLRRAGIVVTSDKHIIVTNEKLLKEVAFDKF